MMVPAGLQRAGALGAFHHGQRDAVLDRAAGVAALAFHPDRVAGAEQALDAHVRGVSDGVEDGAGFHGRVSGVVQSSGHSVADVRRIPAYGYAKGDNPSR
jgi:hypothetical protein